MALNAKRCELIGMVLILVSAGWQIFVERSLAEVEADIRQYKLNHKLDALFSIVSDSYIRQFPEKTINKPHMGTVERIQNWTVADSEREDPMEMLTKWATWITAIVFFWGSILIVYGKWLETKETPPQPIV